MFGIGMQELAVIFVVALLIFGPKRLPELAKTLGKGLAEFRRASNELRQSFMLESDQAPRPPLRPVAPRDTDPREEREPPGEPDQLVEPGASGVDADGHGDLADDEPGEPPAERRPTTETTPARAADEGGPTRD